MYKTDDLRIQSIKDVSPPSQVLAELPITEAAARTTYATRQAIHRVLTGEDDRLLVITGPCSIHDVAAAREYAQKLKAQIDALSDDLLIVMRVYFEKPRTTVGWKGLINDPDLDGSFHINKGLRLARRLLLDLNEMGVPAGTEYLDLITPQYVTDLISWGAIGARTTESQVHRELASGLSCPVGFKNGTDGTIKVAVDAIRAATHPHHFLSMTKDGHSAIFATTGNPDCHIILRGGNGSPNYDAESINRAAKYLEEAKLPVRIMIDFSHANSAKQHERQIEVGHDVARQVASGDRRIIGAMIESHLVAGRQDVVPGRPLNYGQSITDACIGWDDTIELLRLLAGASRKRRATGHNNVTATAREIAG
jgi:3-deoxy-7-phosphoheptulonate synthase